MDNETLTKCAKLARLIKVYNLSGRTDEFWKNLDILLTILEDEEQAINVNS